MNQGLILLSDKYIIRSTLPNSSGILYVVLFSLQVSIVDYYFHCLQLKKNQICTDLFSEKLDPLARGFEDLSLLLEGVRRPLTVTDQWNTKDEPEHPIIVKAILAVGAKYTPTNKEEIFFKCYLQNYVGQTSAEMSEHYVSSAYHPGLMYDGSEWNEMERNMGISIRKYILLSPEFVSSDQTDLENQYVTTQRTLSTFYYIIHYMYKHVAP